MGRGREPSPQEAGQDRAMRSGRGSRGWMAAENEEGSSCGWQWLGEGLRQQAGSGWPQLPACSSVMGLRMYLP